MQLNVLYNDVFDGFPYNAIMSIVYFWSKKFKCLPGGRILDAEKNAIRFCENGMSGICLDIGFSIYIYYTFISQPPIQHTNVDKPKSRYISDLYQLKSMFMVYQRL